MYKIYIKFVFKYKPDHDMEFFKSFCNDMRELKSSLNVLQRLMVLSVLVQMFAQDVFADRIINVMIPSLTNVEVKMTVNGYDKGMVEFPVKSIKQVDGYAKDFIIYEAVVVPILIEAPGPVNLLFEMDYMNPLNGEVSHLSDEIEFADRENFEIFCESKSAGFFNGGTKLKELDWNKGNKKVKSGKYKKLPSIIVNRNEIYSPDAAFLAERTKMKSEQKEAGKKRSKLIKSQISDGVLSIAEATNKLVSDIAQISNGGESSNDSSSEEDGVDNGKRTTLTQKQRQALKKKYDYKIEEIENYYKTIACLHEHQDVIAHSNDSDGVSKIKSLGHDKQWYLNKIFKLRREARKIRYEAKKGGYNIPKSKWEDSQTKEVKVK